MADTRITILGGGLGGLTAALALTDPQRKGPAYDITVYQLGPRLGGKAASTRSTALPDRIHEHGLHLLLGFYENAFAMLRRCYSELDRPPNAPLATWREAFVPRPDVVMMDRLDGEWAQWSMRFARGPGDPGDLSPEDAVMLAPWQYVQMAKEQLFGVLLGALRPSAAIGVTAVREVLRGKPSLTTLRSALHEVISTSRSARAATRRVLLTADLAATVLLGLLADEILSPGGDFAGFQRRLETLDDEDFRAWLTRHGALPDTIAFSPVATFYQLGFSERVPTGAGVILHGLLRLLMTYRGCIMYEMSAGMGETVVAPMYEVLRRRGVRFEFFCRADRLVLNDAHTSIESIELGRQVRTRRNKPYDPLVIIDGLPCWPDEPRYEQLVGGARLRRSGVNLATDAARTLWPDAETLTLRAGSDFDHVILALPPGGQRDVTADLRAAPGDLGRKWTAVYEELRCQPTLSAQCWFDRDFADGRAHGHQAAVGAFEVPWETWSDMSQLLKVERHGPDGPLGLAYLCGTPDTILHDGVDPEDVPDLRARILAATKIWLQDHALHVMPGFANAVGEFDFDTLHDPQGRQGPERLEAQFVHVPALRSDRYVLSPAGTTRCRFTAGDTGLTNLVAAGDWLLTGINAGCVEAAVIGGLQAARALSGFPDRIFGDPRFS